MEKEVFHKNFAPCGLACCYCSACKYGDIANNAKSLVKLLNDQDNYYLKHIVLPILPKSVKLTRNLNILIKY